MRTRIRKKMARSADLILSECAPGVEFCSKFWRRNETKNISAAVGEQIWQDDYLERNPGIQFL